MQIAIVGTGYVGLVAGACFAEFGLDVLCVDSNPARVETLRAGEIPFYEPGLDDVVHRNVIAGRLTFSSDVGEAVRKALVLFLAVGTPHGHKGEADVSQLVTAIDSIAPQLEEYRVIVTKSTVPVGTSRMLQERLRRILPKPVAVDVASNPEFLREGSAVADFMRPQRIVIGTDSARAAAIVKDIYRPLYLMETPLLLTNLETAEMIKCAANAHLAVRISFMNEIANLCDRVGADVRVVAEGLGLDARIGPQCLQPGPGYGGSCFPKDTRALAALGKRHGARQRIVESAIDVNDRQWRLTVEKVRRSLKGATDRCVAVLGLAFKPNTSDVREAPAAFMCAELANAGIAVRAFDPVAIPEARQMLAPLADRIYYAADPYDAIAGASAVVIMTDWAEFGALDLEKVKRLAARPVIIDARNVLDPVCVRNLGFTYQSTGRDAAGRSRDSAEEVASSARAIRRRSFRSEPKAPWPVTEAIAGAGSQ